MNKTPQIPIFSLIIPLYNETDSFSYLTQAIENNSFLNRSNIEIILIDDGSSDTTVNLVRQWSPQHAQVKGIFLSRNFGQQAAINAGLNIAKGELVGIIDSDLQDPLDELIKMNNTAKQTGVDIVYGVRKNRQAPILKKISYRLFYYFYAKLSDFEVHPDSGDFCVLSRKTVNLLNSLPEHVRFNRGLRSWIGLTSVAHPYDRPDRKVGTAKYSWSKLILVAISGITSSSIKPLRVSIVMGLILFVVAIALIVMYLGFYLWGDIGEQVPGFATIIITMLMLNGFQFLLIGVIGEYIGTIYLETKQRPNYIVEDTLNIE